MKYINVAIIAHVDHGKTTLVDALLKQTNTFRENEEVGTTIMDSNDQEIVDTPGHADFGSEVERVLRMVDSVCLVVDAYEGPMPQTKFVLKKALQLGLKPIIVINKIDKPTAQPEAVVDMLFDLFVQLGATDEQLDITDGRIVYAIARDGIAKRNMSDEATDISALFDTIIEQVAVAPNDETKPLRMQIANLAYDSYVGRMGIGRVVDGQAKVGQQDLKGDDFSWAQED